MASMHQQLMARVMSAPMGARLMGVSTTPDSLPGLLAWGEGSDLGADGTGIASWLNKTGSGLDPAQGTAGNQPTVTANAINGQKAARFTAASSQRLLFPAGSLGWFNNVPGVTILSVFQAITLPTVASIVNVSRQPSVAGRAQVVATTTAIRMVAAADDTTVTNVDATATPLGMLVLHAGVFDFSNGSVRNYLNGALASSASVTPQNTVAANSFAIALGGRGDGAQSLDGYLAAYAMYNVAYSRLQIAGVLNRWATLYGITLTV